jgi:hypothetical protein
MEARIEARLRQHAALAPAAESRWRTLFTGSTLAAAWGRGALSGAATALLIVGALLLAQHGLRMKPGQEQFADGEIAATRNTAPTTTPVADAAKVLSASEARANPCATPSMKQVRNIAPTRAGHPLRAETWRDASFAPSHPAPEMPLTAQERALAELARTASPTVLASLSSDAQEKSLAKDEAEFNKFFTPPPTPPQPADSESTTQTNQNQSLL